MIGKVKKGMSSYYAIRYCLEDKKEYSEEQKQEMSIGHLQHKDRAEVLEYNLCFGSNARELANQFKEVEKLSRRVEKPVLHISLSLAPEDNLTKNQLIELSQECAKEFGIADNQYISVLHKDTDHQHIHIAANRVGFDGKVASDKNDFKRMAALCRRLEQQYQLKEVLSPRKFLSPKERLLPRQDIRKDKLRTDIRQTLEKVNQYPAFEQHMKALGYKVIKARGICFIDDKKVKIKGSEVGFSLAKIEKILDLKQQLDVQQAMRKQSQTGNYSRSGQQMLMQNSGYEPAGKSTETQLSNIIDQLLKPEYGANYVSPDLNEGYKRKKKKKQHLSNNF
ncbi:MAG: relaxase/mobilization nuclease domain-containing protein [Taibaiella sp.]|nr:relaxase/mobilization nuclease domain-containing protein [Taibaiella sp.]